MTIQTLKQNNTARIWHPLPTNNAAKAWRLTERKLRKADKKQSLLYLFCNFISLLLITAYSAMMFSPTVLLVLPEGGDSRKQMIAVFVLALFGCLLFTIYASCLFFRKKARQLGILMALGASRKKLAPGLFREVLLLSSFSCLLGILAGIPFIALLWNGFRLLIVDSPEMALRLDFKFLYLSFAFFLLVVAFSCLTAYRYLKRTNIMDVVQEEHKNEPVKELGRWCGPVGFVLILAGAVCGYLAPGIYMDLCSAYPSPLINLFYAPVFMGLYMVMLHTVVRGWRSRKKNPYRNIITRSMMKFQGKQTVNNLLISTVLIAGASFAIFYIPMLSVGQSMEIKARPYDVSYSYRMDQKKIPSPAEIEQLAQSYGTSVCDYKAAPSLILGMDGMREITEGRAFRLVYEPLLGSGIFFSESSFELLTGKEISVAKGSYYGISNEEETSTYYLNSGSTLLSNMTTRKTLSVSFSGYVHYDLLAGVRAHYVISNEDYETISQGLSEEWKNQTAFFNTANENDYAFGRAFFYLLVDSFGPECEYPHYYDRVSKIRCDERKETYWGDTEAMTSISFDEPDSTDFRSYWSYMPKIRTLDEQDSLRTFAVFLMMFLFIAIICFLAAMIISYTRCMTIALNNRYIFDDLKKLGASPAFLLREIKNQAGNVFQIPALVGMSAMYLLYVLLMFGNDGKITSSEIGGLMACLAVLILFALMIYGIYRYTAAAMAKQLSIGKAKRRPASQDV